MRATPNPSVEGYRIRTGPMPSSRADGNNGAFMIPASAHGMILLLTIVSDGGGWEHASVTPRQRGKRGSLALARTPTYAEMDFIKRLFWEDHETVIQYHVPRTDHINVHDFCLHLWRPIDVAIPLPPAAFV